MMADLDSIHFTSNSRHIYDIYAKGYKLACKIIPGEAESISDIIWGWYDPGKEIYSRHVDVDTFEEGSHTLRCSSPNSTAQPFNTTFLVIRELITTFLLCVRGEYVINSARLGSSGC